MKSKEEILDANKLITTSLNEMALRLVLAARMEGLTEPPKPNPHMLLAECVHAVFNWVLDGDGPDDPYKHGAEGIDDLLAGLRQDEEARAT